MYENGVISMVLNIKQEVNEVVKQINAVTSVQKKYTYLVPMLMEKQIIIVIWIYALSLMITMLEKGIWLGQSENQYQKWQPSL